MFIDDVKYYEIKARDVKPGMWIGFSEDTLRAMKLDPEDMYSQFLLDEWLEVTLVESKTTFTWIEVDAKHIGTLKIPHDTLVEVKE